MFIRHPYLVSRETNCIGLYFLNYVLINVRCKYTAFHYVHFYIRYVASMSGSCVSVHDLSEWFKTTEINETKGLEPGLAILVPACVLTCIARRV